MLLDIVLTNCGPFKETAKLSMIPYSYGGKLDNLCEDANGNHVLNTSIIYGKNSAGKTCFIKTLWALVHEVRYPSTPNTRLQIYSPFKLDTETKESQSEVSLRFSIDTNVYQHVIKFNSVEYVYEALSVTSDEGSTEILFERRGTNKSEHQVEFSERGKFGVQKLPLVSRNNLVISQYKQYPGDEISLVANYIANIQVTNGYKPEMSKLLWEDVRTWITNNRTENGNRLAYFLHALDISVEGFTIPGKPDSSFDDITFRHRLYSNGIPTKDKYVQFDITMESQGTKWLLLLGAKIIESLENGYTLIIDEIDASFHFLATKFIIQLFKDPAINKHNAQLILTTHNINLMNEQDLRKDQIWFIEKDSKGISELYSLSEFDGVDEDVNFAEWYLAKRFGGIPTMGTIRELFKP